MSKKLLGVIGGMGAQASADFYDTIIDCTHAPRDQDHIDMLIYSKASIPDRTAAIEQMAVEGVIHALQSAYNTLVHAGANYIVMTCNTSHSFIDRLQTVDAVPIVHIIEEAVSELKRQGVSKVGVLLTDGLAKTNVYHRYLMQYGIEDVYPSAHNQTLVMKIIYEQIKAGLPPDTQMFDTIVQELKEKGVDRVILGCTELSVYAKIQNLGPFFFDPQKNLARRCVELCGGVLKESMRE